MHEKCSKLAVICMYRKQWQFIKYNFGIKCKLYVLGIVIFVKRALTFGTS